MGFHHSQQIHEIFAIFLFFLCSTLFNDDVLGVVKNGKEERMDTKIPFRIQHQMFVAYFPVYDITSFFSLRHENVFGIVCRCYFSTSSDSSFIRNNIKAASSNIYENLSYIILKMNSRKRRPSPPHSCSNKKNHA
jgi:hypothetical protein